MTLSAEKRRAGLVEPPEGVPGVVARIAKPSGEVVVPANVKLTRCPSGRDTRYTAEGPFIGQFTREWNQKRSEGR